MKKFWTKELLVLMMVLGLTLPFVSMASAARCVPGELSDGERDSLVFMRQEEKLARDVYTYLFGVYKTPIFRNIARSEQRHMDAIKVLLDRYNIPDPVEGMGQGEFQDPSFAELYRSFVEEGDKSLIDALNVGVQIEEDDIDQIQTALGVVDNKDITNVYLNLLKASGKHLKAFTNVLSKHGVSVGP